MFDIKKIEADAIKEANEERANAAKSRIKAKLKQIADAKKIVANLEGEYAALLTDIGTA